MKISTRLVSILAASLAYTSGAWASDTLPSLHTGSLQSFVQAVVDAKESTLETWTKSPSSVPGYSALRPNSQGYATEIVTNLYSYEKMLDNCYQLMSPGRSALKDRMIAKWSNKDKIRLDEADADYRQLIAEDATLYKSYNYRQYNGALLTKINLADKLFDVVRAEGGSADDQRAVLQYALDTAHHVHENIPDQYLTDDIRSQMKARDEVVELLKKKLSAVK